jgi:hypothetical protein
MANLKKISLLTYQLCVVSLVSFHFSLFCILIITITLLHWFTLNNYSPKMKSLFFLTSHFYHLSINEIGCLSRCKSIIPSLCQALKKVISLTNIRSESDISVLKFPYTATEFCIILLARGLGSKFDIGLDRGRLSVHRLEIWKHGNKPLLH